MRFGKRDCLTKTCFTQTFVWNPDFGLLAVLAVGISCAELLITEGIDLLIQGKACGLGRLISVCSDARLANSDDPDSCSCRSYSRGIALQRLLANGVFPVGTMGGQWFFQAWCLPFSITLPECLGHLPPLRCQPFQ